ncbi:hypothetical protein MTP10_30910 [Nonomuraea sp. 3-1Str]|uniref:hypothetical protein n=1 Tax=Nonomuraea sp. 3-1Str TaxID=2929801 RepID=UPI00285FA2E8|nr:hypothetical protein [Nonomuraea sp. 3-1Str]MDR8413130.1 hypothetical protein [Nonomuraea sp. 3-1Str]
MNGNVFPRLVSATLITAAIAALPAPAGAATIGYTPEQVCGGGFARVSSGTRPVTDHTNTIRGYAYLLYNARTGEHCAVTVKSDFVGTPTMTRASLVVETNTIFGPARYTDQGAFKFYAGPVKARTNGKCVSFGGAVSSGADESASGIRASGSWGGYGDCPRDAMRQRGIAR